MDKLTGRISFLIRAVEWQVSVSNPRYGDDY